MTMCRNYRTSFDVKLLGTMGGQFQNLIMITHVFNDPWPNSNPGVWVKPGERRLRAHLYDGVTT
eukprot:CAMPEP_0170187036 /NCGR_PEP_ID=MMETSP0040_2-20121228/40745_1 /TAXON_ID=641309 /ORGANISM="Lotharella oceanica, Strain CCMP622" /LENGTH=63 /DNA_ID=CAMNT_0010433955 /DNA_START=103 /DNA_END=291 /DNA_ORIENTATION=+